MRRIIIFVFLVIITGVTATPKFHVHTTVYDYKFRISDNPKFPYSSIDVNPKFGRVVFLIVGANDYTEITKNQTLGEDYRDLEDKIKYNHGAHLALIGCIDFSPHDLFHVDDFIRQSGDRKIRAFGYGIFNTNYTIIDNLWDDDSVDLLLNKFMKKIYGNDFQRHETPNEYITLFDPNPTSDRFESFRMNTFTGRFDTRVTVTFLLINGDKMDVFLKRKYHKAFLTEIIEDDYDPFGLVFLLGCYNFRKHFYLIADTIEQQKTRLVERHRGPIKPDNIRVYVQGRGIWSCDFVYIKKPIVKLIPNVEMEALEPFLDLYYEKTSKHTEYAVYDCNLNYVKQLRFEYLNGLYKSHNAADSFTFDTSSKVIKIIFATKAHFDNVSANKGKLSKLKQLLRDLQHVRHKVYLVVCYAEISTYPNVIASMLDAHLGNYLKKNLGEVWLNAPETFGTILRDGDGGQFKEWPYKPIDVN